jgi:prevent-host-death family protein
MDERVSATIASRSFSRLLREAQKGRTYLITVRGRPVARLVPANVQDRRTIRFRRAALRALLKRTKSQPAVDIGKWTRDELYERGYIEEEQ